MLIQHPAAPAVIPYPQKEESEPPRALTPLSILVVGHSPTNIKILGSNPAITYWQQKVVTFSFDNVSLQSDTPASHLCM